MRVAVLWTNLSGYFNASLQDLSEKAEDLFVSYASPVAGAPFDETIFQWLANRYCFQASPDLDALLARLEDFDPSLLLISGWHIPVYRQIARRYQGRALRILCMDNQWLGTLRQYLGVGISPWLIQPLYDAAFVASPGSARFAHYLGFPHNRICQGVYSADTRLFAGAIAPDPQSNRQFIQVSRLIPEKGIDVLIDAYRQYRAKTQDPWSLTLCGTGPEAYRLEGIEGVRVCGFLQPDALRRELATAGCFILASRFEPWGVALHEAACAGLPIICTTACGASRGLVQDGYNGFVVPPESPGDLGQAMLRISRLTDQQRESFGHASKNLSQQYSPQRFSDTVCRLAQETGLAR